MPSQALGMGAGASDGLEILLARMRAEEVLKQQQARGDEETRSNKANEDYRNRALKSTDDDRMLRMMEAISKEKDLDSNRDEQRRQGEEQRAVEQWKMLAPGTNVPEEEASKFFLRGIPRSAAGAYDPPAGEAELQTGGRTEAKPIGTFKRLMTAEDQAKMEALGKTSAVNSEVKTVTYQGKPVDANYDPRTQKYTYRGQDITDQVGHYEKPPAPDRVLLQSGEGYTTRADATKKLAAGENVPLATTSSTRTMQEGAQMLQPHIDKLEQTATELDKRGLFGPVMSRVRQAMTKAGTLDEFQKTIANDPEMNTDRLAGRFATSLGLLATGAGRVHGGARGGGSPQMYQHFKEILSDASSLQMFLGRLDSLNEYMATYAEGPSGASSTAPAATGGGTKVGRFTIEVSK